ncbi:unnamed protein product [Lactuca saligna]|uniref:Uncharacterized protein n=1 Tax=Lactuca saligna TaxID=75948 RepID=A0AA36E2K7_LACSI|nr:unnamed protein product [Lactuca saligna]
MNTRLAKVERDVTAMKQLMNLGDDDDDMVVNDTPPNSPCDNPPPHPPPSLNPPPPSPPPSHPPTPTPSPPVPLNVVYPNSYFKGEVPHGTNSDIVSDDDQLNPGNRKAYSSQGYHEAEAGSSISDDSLTTPPFTKSKLILDINELVATWRFSVGEVNEIMMETNASIQQKKEARKEEHMSAKLV